MKRYIVLLTAVATALHCGVAAATGSFGEASVTSQVFCDMPSIKGNFSAPQARYTASGVCVKVTAEQSKPAGSSQFDDYNHSHEDYRVQWTAEGSYNPTTKEAAETITAPAPTLNEPSPPGRPYGRFIAKMICAEDPWLSFAAKCVSVSTSATGNLGPDLVKAMAANIRPFSSRNKGAQQDALIAAKKKADTPKYSAVVRDTDTSPYKIATAAAPSIVEPKPGSTHSPQTAMRIRVKAPLILTPRDFKVQTYELQFQSKQKNGTWQLVTSAFSNAAEAEGDGYLGWGAHTPGTSAQMTATVGTWRVRPLIKDPVQVKNPELNIGEWVEFVIAGVPGGDVLVSPYSTDTSARNAQFPVMTQPAATAQSKAGAASTLQKITPIDAANTPASALRR